MPSQVEWTEVDVRAVADALEYHGSLSDRIVDDLADSLRRSPQAIRSKVRQLKLRDRQKAKAGEDMPGSLPASEMGQVEAPVCPEPEAPVQKPEAVARRSKPGKAAVPAPYTDLIDAIVDLEVLAERVTKARRLLDSAACECSAAESALTRCHADLVLRFPAARLLLDRALPPAH